MTPTKSITFTTIHPLARETRKILSGRRSFIIEIFKLLEKGKHLNAKERQSLSKVLAHLDVFKSLGPRWLRELKTLESKSLKLSFGESSNNIAKALEYLSAADAFQKTDRELFKAYRDLLDAVARQNIGFNLLSGQRRKKNNKAEHYRQLLGDFKPQSTTAAASFVFHKYVDQLKKASDDERKRLLKQYGPGSTRNIARYLKGIPLSSKLRQNPDLSHNHQMSPKKLVTERRSVTA